MIQVPHEDNASLEQFPTKVCANWAGAGVRGTVRESHVAGIMVEALWSGTYKVLARGPVMVACSVFINRYHRWTRISRTRV